MTNETDSLIQEVEEQVRQDRLVAMAKRYGPILIGVFIAVAVAIIGWQLYQNAQLEASYRQADAFSRAQTQAREGELEAAAASFEEMSKEGPRSYRIMSMMERAALHQQQGDLEASLAEFDRAAEAASEPLLRDTARLRAAYVAAETQDFQAVRTRLEPLIESDTAVSFLARELLAIEAWEAGETAVARQTLQGLTLAFEAPESVRERAEIALSVLGPAPAGEAAAPAPAEPNSGETK